MRREKEEEERREDERGEKRREIMRAKQNEEKCLHTDKFTSGKQIEEIKIGK